MGKARAATPLALLLRGEFNSNDSTLQLDLCVYGTFFSYFVPSQGLKGNEQETEIAEDNYQSRQSFSSNYMH